MDEKVGNTEREEDERSGYDKVHYDTFISKDNIISSSHQETGKLEISDA